MPEFLFRCSSLGKLMASPKLKSEVLSVGAKTYIRELALQEILSVDFEVSSKQMEKGIRCEDESIYLLNRVRGIHLKKNTERKSNGLITGECDLFNEELNKGHDIKTSWSAQTFKMLSTDCHDKLYEWQMRGYMMLWDAGEWEVNYCLVDTPDELIRYEPMQIHMVSHIPEHMRVTTWLITRDKEKEDMIKEKVIHAREYYKEVIEQFNEEHKGE